MSKLYVFVALIPVVFGSTLTQAQEIRFIEVTGEASVKARPDSFQIRASLSADDEKSTINALKKFEETKNKFNTALNPMIFEKVQVVYQQTEIGSGSESQQAQVMIAMGREDVAADSRFVVKESALVKRTGVGAMSEEEVKRLVAKLADTIVKHGGSLGPEANNMFGWNMKQGSVSYSISDPSTHAAKAQSAAMTNAKEKAAALAKLSGGRVGRVLFVKEEGIHSENAPEMQQAVMMMQAYGVDLQQDSFSVDSYRDISIQSSLKVRFELLDE